MKDLLANYYNFGECILLDMRWKQWGFSLELVFNYIWKERDVVRDDLDVEERVIIRFSAVQEFHASYEWNDHILSKPDVIDWGSAEVSQVRLEDGEAFLGKYHSRPVSFHHVAVRWESERRMDIVFSALEIFKE